MFLPRYSLRILEAWKNDGGYCTARIKTLSIGKRAFKLFLSRREFDRVIYDAEANTCEGYEIKHSIEKLPNRTRALLDEERKCDVEYLNMQDYRKSL